jgi:hypothetical protein
VNLTSPLERPRRGLSIVFVRYDREKYARAWESFQAHLRTIASPSIETVIVDNAEPDRPAERLGECLHAIGGSNRAWEFSAFDEGVEWLRLQDRLRDVTLLATDAFAAYGGEFIDLVDEGILRFCRRQAAAVGWIDSFEEPCRLFGTAYNDWLRTSYLILPSTALAGVEPFAAPMSEDELFDTDWRRRWKRDAPVSPSLRRRIDHWLTGLAEGQRLAAADTWHSRFDVDAGTFPFFKAKARAILREHHLSIRLRAARVRIFDLRVVADRLARGGSPLLGTSDESLDGLKSLRSREMAEAGAEVHTSTGQRLVFAGDLLRTADVAAARRFSTHVMPLVLQRFPAATFELPVASPSVPVAALAGVNNTRVTTPQQLARERPEEMAARVIPIGVNASAALGTPLDASKWAALESIEMGNAPAGQAASRQSAVAVAASCCAALSRAAASISSTAAPIDVSEGEVGNDEAGAGDEIGPEAFETVSHRWRADHRRWRHENAALLEEREDHERSLVKGAVPFVVQGLCYHCGRETPLHVDFEFGGDPLASRPNWRERLVCQVCGLNSKMRGLLHVLREVVVPKPDPCVLVWELEDELTDVLRSKFDDVTGVIGGVGLPEVAGSTLYDCLLVVDMFERERDLGEAIDRSLALLSPGGGMVFSAAFLTDRERNRLLSDAEPGGARREFGWAMLQSFRDAGFEDVVAHFFWSRAFAYLGREQVVFVARKPGLGGSNR